MAWLEIDVAGGSITIEPRPPHCDRGRVVAKVHVTDPRFLFVSSDDSWPRYYFDALTAVIECQEWLAAKHALDCHDQERPQWWLRERKEGQLVGREVDPIMHGLLQGNSHFLIKWLLEGPKVQ